MNWTRSAAIALCFTALSWATATAQTAPTGAGMPEDCMAKARAESDPAKRRGMEAEYGRPDSAPATGGGAMMQSPTMGGTMGSTMGGSMSAQPMTGGSMNQMAPNQMAPKK